MTSSRTPTITPSLTSTFTITPLPSPTIDPECNRAAFVKDITIPDGTIINATEKFTKTWRFKNIGTCAWTTSYKFVFIGGDKMGALDSINIPNTVAPNETIDISIDLVAPLAPSKYKGVWSFEDNTGKRFGLGKSSTGQIWIQVKVISAPTSTSTPTLQPTEIITATSNPPPLSVSPVETQVYDFVSQICSAQWQSNNGAESCPGSGSGAAVLATGPALEDGVTFNNPAILINAGSVNGFFRGIYPEYLVQPGDHFRVIASCEGNATACSALFRVSYQELSNAPVDLWAVGEFYDGKYTTIDIDLGPLAGKKIKFILDVTPLNSDPNNRVLWADPIIYREPLPTSTPTIAPTAIDTATFTPPPTITPMPSSTSTPAPQVTKPGSTLEKIRKFFDDLFKNLFGG